MRTIEYHNASEFVKNLNEKREQEGRTLFNLSQFRRKNRFYNLTKEDLESQGIQAEVITQGRTGETLVCKELFLIIQIFEDPKKIVKILQKVN